MRRTSIKTAPIRRDWVQRVPIRTALIVLAAPLLLPAGACSWGSGPSRDPGERVQAQTRDRVRAAELFSEGSRLHERGDTDEALEKYRASIEADDTFFAAWNNLGQLLMARRNYADAVAAFRVAGDLQPSDPRPEYNIGLAYQTIGWGEESYDHFERALERDPNYLPALRGVVRSAEMIGMGTPTVLGHIRNARLRESDERWREYFDRQHFRVQKLIEEQG